MEQYDAIFGRQATAEEQGRIEALKAHAAAYRNALLALPGSRERSLAITKVEEAAMWGTKAVLTGSDAQGPTGTG